MQFTVPTDEKGSVLGIVQSFCRSYAQPVPAAINGSSDAGALQLREMLQEVGDFCHEYTNWEYAIRDTTWTSVAAEEQGAIATLFPDDCSQLIESTIWNRDERELIQGPVSPQEWAAFQANFMSPNKRCYVARRRLYIWPAPEAGQTYSGIYKSRQWLVSVSGTSKSYITADDDFPLLPVTLMKQGLVFYWKRAKELPYAVEEARFMDMLSDLGSQNMMRETLQMDNQARAPRPGIIVPITNWGQP
jgi:hypothetical protein